MAVTGYGNVVSGGSAPARVLSETDQQLIDRAKAIILDAMNAPLIDWSDGDVRRVDLAKWVIDHRFVLTTAD